MRLTIHACFLLLSVVSQPTDRAAANEHPCARGKEISGAVATSPRRGGFALAGDGRSFHLSGLVNPAPMVEGSDVSLYLSADQPDRYGRWSVHGFSSGKWVQGELLEQGRHLVSGFGEVPDCLKALRVMERRARAAKRGVWADEALVLKADEVDQLAERIGQFVIVEGVVVSVGNRDRRLYLNFGQNWAQDFTASVVKKGSGAFKEVFPGGLDRLTRLKGKKVLLRGMLEERQGPLMRLVDEAQIEVLD